MMHLLAILLLTIGFYFLYNTSKRALLRKDDFSLWLQAHPRFSKLFGLLFGYFSFKIFISLNGVTAGTLYASTTLMAISSLIIILSPLTITNK